MHLPFFDITGLLFSSSPLVYTIPMNYATIGVFAHVDAGKTTLCEGMLYQAQAIRALGRVDHGDTWLDYNPLERKRGITIFSKQAIFTLGDTTYTLVDTPGHIDFSVEAERVMPILDAALLIISGTEGLQPHTQTLWSLLERYHIPTIVFVTKMDIAHQEPSHLLAQLKQTLGPGMEAVETSALQLSPAALEELALQQESLMETYLTTGALDLPLLFQSRLFFPVFFGSGLTMDGVETLLQVLPTLVQPHFPTSFLGHIYKLSKDERGQRLAFVKINGGTLRIRQSLTYTDVSGATQEDKITGLWIYNGEKGQAVEEAYAGQVVAVAGLSRPSVGLSLGEEDTVSSLLFEPVLRYTLSLPEGSDAKGTYQQLLFFNEENPSLHLQWDSLTDTITLQLMGAVQLEILEQRFQDVLGFPVSFTQGEILYKETIADTVEGIGHFEPLRHYAEVHLLLEPGQPGSGISVSSRCPTDNLPALWQNQILSVLRNYEHKGVLGGYPLTDVQLVLVSGKTHLTHTEAGDIREATLRAVRQGLMQANSVLLEPVYRYTLTLPNAYTGRAITDLRNMGGDFQLEQGVETSTLTGDAPVVGLQYYALSVASYTSGEGQLQLVPNGYRPCSDAAPVLEARAYDPNRDTENPSDSVFCKQGSGFFVRWDQVDQYMHLPRYLQTREKSSAGEQRHRTISLDEKELEALMEREFGPIRRKQYGTAQIVHSADEQTPATTPHRVLLVDGYNLLFGWEDLKQTAKDSLDLAREQLNTRLQDYAGYTGMEVVVLYDAYRNPIDDDKKQTLPGLDIRYTDVDETADAYLERLANRLGKNDLVTVVSSDNLVRLGVFRSGVQRQSVSSFLEAYEQIHKEIAAIIDRTLENGQRLGDVISREELLQWLNNEN